MVIRESEDMEDMSVDEELSDWQDDNMIYVKRIIHSSNEVDARLLKLYKVCQADNSHIHLGFNTKTVQNQPRFKKSFTTSLKNDNFISKDSAKIRDKAKSQRVTTTNLNYLMRIDSLKLTESSNSKNSFDRGDDVNQANRIKNYRVNDANRPSSPSQIKLREFRL